MSTIYASGKWAIGICDRCGLRMKYDEMVWDGDTQAKTLRVHPECRDSLSPYIVIAKRNQTRMDKIALRYPRPRKPMVVE